MLFASLLLGDSVSILWEVSKQQEVIELSDIADFDFESEKEKENKKNGKELDDKIPLRFLCLTLEPSQLQTKNLLAKIFLHLHHSEITTPPPEQAILPFYRYLI